MLRDRGMAFFVWVRPLAQQAEGLGAEWRHLPCTSIAVEGKDALQVVYHTTTDGTLQVWPPCCHSQRSGLSCTFAALIAESSDGAHGR